MSVSGHFHAKSGRKILYTCNYVLYTKYEYQTILIYIWTKPSTTAPNLQETFPKPIHFLTDQLISDASRDSGGGPRGVLDPMIPWTRISDVLGCCWLYMATNGLTIAPRWSSGFSVFFLLLQLVAMGVEMQSNMNLYTTIFMNLNNIIQAGEVLSNSSSNTNRVE